MTPESKPERRRVSERYVIYDEIASGGMGSVHLGRLKGPVGFSRVVAIKRLHSAYAKDPDFVAMFLDEARLAARVQHPNVVSTIDVVTEADEVFLVMDYVEGESLSHLMKSAQKRGEPVPLPVVTAISVNLLTGLDAAHRAKGEMGAPLGIVHRDVSPQNVLVGIDGLARVVDFGVAKAAGRLQTTRDGQIKGKAAYMAPEQLRGRNVDARADVYGAAVVVWELITGGRLFSGNTPEETVIQILERDMPAPSESRPGVPPELDRVVLSGLARDPEDRFTSAREMAMALEKALTPATQREVAEWVEASLSDAQRARRERIQQFDGDEVTPATLLAPAVGERPEPTSISRISVATKRVEVPGPRRRTPLVPLLLLAGLGIAAVLGWRATRAQVDTPPSGAFPATVSVRPELPLPETSTTPVALPTSPPPAPSQSAPVKPVRIQPRAKKQCKPPWRLDQNGFRIPKPECF
jgi:serine/threonine protein kinase